MESIKIKDTIILELLKQRELLVKDFIKANESEWRNPESSIKTLKNFDECYGKFIKLEQHKEKTQDSKLS